jgi:hypothetical protein
MDSNETKIEVGEWYWHSLRNIPVFVIGTLSPTMVYVLMPRIRLYRKPKMVRREVSICQLVTIMLEDDELDY